MLTLAVDGLKIRGLRESQGLSRRECCQMASISHKTLRNVEDGLDARPNTIRAIAGVLEVDPKLLASVRGGLSVLSKRVA